MLYRCDQGDIHKLIFAIKECDDVVFCDSDELFLAKLTGTVVVCCIDQRERIQLKRAFYKRAKQKRAMN